MAYQRDYRLRLTLAGPILSQATGVLAFGVDTAMLRYRDEPVLSGSLIRGNIRHALEAFKEWLPESLLSHIPNPKDSDDQAGYIERWFGLNSQGDVKNTRRANVDFDFFWKLDTASVATYRAQTRRYQRIRIELEEETGKVSPGALQVIEDCFPAGTQATFSGMIHLRARTAQERRDFVHWLGKALDYIPALGSLKGVGFGQLLAWEIEELPEPSHKTNKAQTQHFPDGDTRRGLTLRFDRPLCLGRPRTPEANRIISDDIIAGTVLKGVLARQFMDLTHREATALHPDDLIISHALPLSETADAQRPLAKPLSLACHQDGVIDAAVLNAEKLMAQSAWYEAPKFCYDWKRKDEAAVTAAWGQSLRPSRFLAVRTAINQHFGVAEENQLFTLECVDPEGFIWCADIDLCRIEAAQRGPVFNELQKLWQHGLSGIGKTKARATVSVGPAWTPLPAPGELKPWRDDLYIVCLQSMARLLPSNLQLSGVNSHQALKEHYQAYWHLQHAGIELVNYYARQELTGVYYYQIQKNPQLSHYYPEWLSSAGSVFVLRIRDAAALQCLRTWCATGLPAHPNADGSAANWLSTPFLPENGYGEIRVNEAKQLQLIERTMAGAGPQGAAGGKAA